MGQHIPALIELLDAQGQVRQSFRVSHWPLRMGRALDNDIVLDDPHVAPHHAQLLGATTWADGGVVLSLGLTLNGAEVTSGPQRGRRLAGGEEMLLQPGQVWRLGTSLLRVRLADETLPAEQRLEVHGHGAWGTTLAWCAAALVWPTLDYWLSATPGTELFPGVKSVLSMAVAAALWCGLWALATLLFQRRLAFAAHVRVFLPLLVLMQWLEVLLEHLSFTAGMALWSRLAFPVVVVVGTYLVWRHLCLLSPARKLPLAVTCSVALVCASGITLYTHHRQFDRWFEPLYASTLAPPGWRWVQAKPAAFMLEELQHLEAPLRELAASPSEGMDEEE
jgi:hypothetical protein